MKKNNKIVLTEREIKRDKETALHYIRTFSDTVREPFLILNPDLRIVGANASFYKNFCVTKGQTENKLMVGRELKKEITELKSIK